MHPRSIKAGSRSWIHSWTHLHQCAVRILAMALAMLPLLTHAGAAKQAVVLDINGAIGPAIADYVVRNLRSARPAEVGVVILRMNTPGGLDSSMREINAAILASPVPVATYVAPHGARAASAGTYIAYAPDPIARTVLPSGRRPATAPEQRQGQGEPRRAPGRRVAQGRE